MSQEPENVDIKDFTNDLNPEEPAAVLEDRDS
jgi:hypothetical protein